MGVRCPYREQFCPRSNFGSPPQTPWWRHRQGSSWGAGGAQRYGLEQQRAPTTAFGPETRLASSPRTRRPWVRATS
nr:hypothetical protein [uncultured bacterium]